MGLFDSVSYVALHSALDGLSLRQRAIADNVANINTPGYTARRVSFEQALSAAVGHGSGAVTATVRFLDREDGVGYSIAAALEVKAPGLDQATIEQVMALAHDICPYSHLIRNVHDVELTAVAEAA